jgi:hypothetical protein
VREREREREREIEREREREYECVYGTWADLLTEIFLLGWEGQLVFDASFQLIAWALHVTIARF